MSMEGDDGVFTLYRLTIKNGSADIALITQAGGKDEESDGGSTALSNPDAQRCSGLGMPDTTPTPVIETFHFSIGGFGQYNEYAIDSADLTFVYTLTEMDYGEQAGTFKQHWSVEKWDAFIGDVLDCGVLDWGSSYRDPDVQDGTQWSLEMTRDFGSIQISGSNAYPEEWGRFLKVLGDHFELNVS